MTGTIQGGSGRAIGVATDRVDGAAKVTGAATYTAEFAPPGMVHAGLVGSTIPRGRVTKVDAAAALALDGVLAVVTHEDAGTLIVPRGGIMFGDWRPPLVDDRVHYVGEAVAVVVAETFEQVREACSLVHVEYEVEESTLLDVADADAMFAAAAHAHGHEADEDHERGDLDVALATDGAVVVDHTYRTAETTHSPMEPHATIAWWDGDRSLTVHDCSQGVSTHQQMFATAFGLEPGDVHVLCPYVGGAFGCKGATWPHALLTALVARRIGRPVKLVLTRPQMFTSVGYRPATVQRVRLAATRDGDLLGIGHDSVNESAELTDWLESCCRSTSVTLYDCDNVRTTQRIARANINPATFMRAPGETPGTFALESAMDELAAELGMDPLELRLRNYAERDPSTGKPWSERRLRECYERGAERFGWSRRSHEPGSMRDGATRIGWGMASCVFLGLRRGSSARVWIGRGGRAGVDTSGADLGTGAYTVCAIIASDVLGLRPDAMTVQLGDSSLPKAPLAGGSSLTASMGEAVAAACRALAAKVLALAAADPDSPLAGLEPDDVDHVDGRLVLRADPRRSASYDEILASAGEDRVEVELHTEHDPEDAENYAMQTTGAHFVEVHIDELVPRIDVRRVVTVIDTGRIVNPRAARSQVYGSIVMGLGMALTEETIRDPRTGAPVTANLADYAVQVHADAPDIVVEFTDVPDARVGSVGARGPGEVGTTGLAAAVANAVHHATGRRIRQVPITPDLLL